MVGAAGAPQEEKQTRVLGVAEQLSLHQAEELVVVSLSRLHPRLALSPPSRFEERATEFEGGSARA